VLPGLNSFVTEIMDCCSSVLLIF